MTPEQKAAFIMAQAAVLNAEIAGMVAENIYRQACGKTIAYDEQAFEVLVGRSSCHHNVVITFFGG